MKLCRFGILIKSSESGHVDFEIPICLSELHHFLTCGIYNFCYTSKITLTAGPITIFLYLKAGLPAILCDRTSSLLKRPVQILYKQLIRSPKDLLIFLINTSINRRKHSCMCIISKHMPNTGIHLFLLFFCLIQN